MLRIIPAANHCNTAAELAKASPSRTITSHGANNNNSRCSAQSLRRVSNLREEPAVADPADRPSAARKGAAAEANAPDGERHGLNPTVHGAIDACRA